MPTKDAATERQRDSYARYSYRRELSLTELMPAVGVAVGAGLFAFYIARLLLQRTPLIVERGGASHRAATRPGAKRRA